MSTRKTYLTELCLDFAMRGRYQHSPLRSSLQTSLYKGSSGGGSVDSKTYYYISTASAILLALIIQCLRAASIKGHIIFKADSKY